MKSAKLLFLSIKQLQFNKEIMKQSYEINRRAVIFYTCIAGAVIIGSIIIKVGVWSDAFLYRLKNSRFCDILF